LLLRVELTIFGVGGMGKSASVILFGISLVHPIAKAKENNIIANIVR
jgi:hypothetical protein